MAYTAADLESVRSAILALATGERVARVTLGDKSVEYGQADLEALRALRREIQGELESSGGRRRYVLTQTSKGL